MRKIRKLYRKLPIAKKIFSLNVLMIVTVLAAVMILAQIIFERSVLQIATNNYIQKFETASDNSTRILSDAARLSKTLCMDEAVEEWFLTEKGEEGTAYLSEKIAVERRLDYIDSLYPEATYSSITIFDAKGNMVNTNNIRNRQETYGGFFDYISMNTKEPVWFDMFKVQFGNYDKNGIAYVRPYREYVSGRIKGYVLIEFDEQVLIHNFAALKYYDEGRYLIVDGAGNVKIDTDRISDINVSKEAYFEIAVDNKYVGQTISFQGERYLVTTEKDSSLGWYMVGLTPIEVLTRENRVMQGTVLAIAFLAIMISVFVSKKISYGVTEPIVTLSSYMERVGKGELSLSVPISSEDEIGILERSFNKMTDEINGLITQVYMEQKAKRKFELSTLQSQINPHFLYNTLSSAFSLVKLGKREDSLKMLQSISQFYRTSLSSGKTVITIREEMENIRSYINIQSMRYGKKLEFDIQVNQEIFDQHIVKLTLQPLVENAIYHGIKENEGQGYIKIDSTVGNGCIYIRVNDNGVGMPLEKVNVLLGVSVEDSENSFGLYSVNQRLKLYFGEQYGIMIVSEKGSGTTVTVKIPYDRGEG